MVESVCFAVSFGACARFSRSCDKIQAALSLAALRVKKAFGIRGGRVLLKRGAGVVKPPTHFSPCVRSNPKRVVFVNFLEIGPSPRGLQTSTTQGGGLCVIGSCCTGEKMCLS